MMGKPRKTGLEKTEEKQRHRKTKAILLIFAKPRDTEVAEKTREFRISTICEAQW
jgi:hypothetical protein